MFWQIRKGLCPSVDACQPGSPAAGAELPCVPHCLHLHLRCMGHCDVQACKAQNAEALALCTSHPIELTCLRSNSDYQGR